MRLLHVTAHLGGGVGKVLSRLVEASARRNDGITHTIACLEPLEKTGFADHARAHGATVLVTPDDTTLDAAVRDADIVQLEWWHHPVVAGWMGRADLPPMRLVVWAHVSGNGSPTIPAGFLRLPHRFLFSSTCSSEFVDLPPLADLASGRIATVFSAGGFDDLPPPPARSADAPLRFGYLGTLDYAKLHPHVLDFIAAVRDPDFVLHLHGDAADAASLMAEARARGLDQRLALHGYATDVGGTLCTLDVMPYLLNQAHYGTAENALLEAMAMGVVPIVLGNPAECALVTHEHTGLVISTPDDFAAALRRLTDDGTLRQRLSAQAASEVRDRFDIKRTADALMTHYRAILTEDRRPIDFRPVFGATAADWFLACQPGIAQAEPPAVPASQTRNKGSVFHYARTFPDDRRLAQMAQQFEACA